ncbi:MAG: hypothetical protein A3H91_07220 [Gammaproteobacteria bacterium RIFCSPLOWO2_02_FULL_61_13]|nr:MAG: hypothetical protein A3H91_07220 [Gammaproteobacteria bacterium RIFCSPLOWO2_02_FULL_61_13]
MTGHSGHRLPVIANRKVFTLAGNTSHHIAVLTMSYVSHDLKARLPVSGNFTQAWGAKGPAAGQQKYRLKQRGLSTAVRPLKQIESRTQIQFQLYEVADVLNLKGSDKHLFLTANTA